MTDKEHLEECSQEKIKVEECIICGKKAMRMHYRKKDSKWKTAYGKCENCGAKLIV